MDGDYDNDSNYSSEGGSEAENFGGEEAGERDEGEDDEWDLDKLPLTSTFSGPPSPDISSGEEESEKGSEKELVNRNNNTSVVKGSDKMLSKKSYFVCELPCSYKEYNVNKKLTDALEEVQKMHLYKGEQW